MSLTRLTRDEMLALTSPWLDEARPHPLMPHVPGWRELAPRLRGVHEELTVMPADGTPAAALGERLALADRQHDRMGRVVERILSGHIELADDAETRALYKRLLELVLPNGLGANIQISWGEEAGRAVVRERALSPEVRAQLRGVPVAAGSLDGIVDRMQRHARDIGDMLAERDTADPPVVTPERMRAARNLWARLVRHVLEAAALSPTLTEANKRALSDPFERAEKLARQRARDAGEDDDDPIVVPTPPSA